jgi:LytR cell envelope-related transcriptional attenuator
MTDFVDILEQQLVDAHGRRERFVPPWRTGMVLAAAAGAAAIVVALIIGLASPGSEQGTRPPAGQTTPPVTTPVHPPPPTTIAVLNGTTIAGQASLVAEELTARGYSEPIVVSNDMSNRSRQHSEVFYEDGHRTDAYGVADCLHIRFDRVHAMTPSARALASRADIVVFVGTDETP